MDLSSLLSQVPQDTLLVLLAYTVLGGLYLV
ncbi:MAG: NAD(P)H-quinone oxidoreductase, partial [Cyanobium sp. RS427]|nr:NAD(P)H-quinone oxidoreductase [Cyanobium sp. RS427]